MGALSKTEMSGDGDIPPRSEGWRYEAVLRVSEALSACREPENLTRILSEQLREFLDFLQFYIIVYRENSTEVEWAVLGQEKSLVAAYADVPVEQRPSWQSYVTQEPFHIVDWNTDERVPARLKQGIAAQGLVVGPLVFVPLTTPRRRLGAMGMSGRPGTIYNSDDVSFLRLIGRVLAFAIDDNFNFRRVEAAHAELQRQHERLQRSERELREVIEKIPSMAWSAAADGNAEFFNRRWLDYAGLTADQAGGTGWTVALHPEDMYGLLEYWRGMLATERPGEFEARLRRFDGEYRWFLFRATPAFDEDGKLVKWYGTNTDIEELKRAEQALRRTEAYLAEAQRLTLTGSYATDGNTFQSIYWSEEMFRLWGFDPRQGLPTWDQWFERIHPEDRQKVKLAADRAFLEKVDSDTEFRILKPDGTVRIAHGIGHPVFSPNGDVFQVVGTLVDITERRSAEEALRRSEKEFRDAIDTIPAMVWTCLPDGSDVFVNKRWSEYVGLTAAEALGSGWQAALHPEDLQEQVEKWHVSLISGETLDVESRYRRAADGQYRWMIVRGVPFRDQHGNILRWYGTLTDIEDRRRAEHLQADLAHVNRVSTLGELTASLAHEIKQPIGAAVTNAEACLRFLDRDQPDLLDAREAALEMTRDARHAADIIDRLRLLYQKGAPQLETVDVNELIREVLTVVRLGASHHSVTFRTDLVGGLPKAMADRVQLQQVLMNLTLNGIEAMRDMAGELGITSQLAEDRQLLISVSDTGIGLPNGKADQIFNAFFTTKPEGTGLGLAITRSIVESHGGRVWAAANSGRGTTFYFTLPIGTTVAA